MSERIHPIEDELRPLIEPYDHPEIGPYDARTIELAIEEIGRLRASNAELLAACKLARNEITNDYSEGTWLETLDRLGEIIAKNKATP